MSHVQTSWKPSRRNIKIEERPEWVPQAIYDSALASKRQYNQDWEYWVWGVSQQYNVSQAEAEVACIRGIYKEFLKVEYAYYLHYFPTLGEVNAAAMAARLGKWYREFLDMDSIFKNIVHPTYLKELGYRQGSMSIEVKDNGRESKPE